MRTNSWPRFSKIRFPGVTGNPVRRAKGRRRRSAGSFPRVRAQSPDDAARRRLALHACRCGQAMQRAALVSWYLAKRTSCETVALSAAGKGWGKKEVNLPPCRYPLRGGACRRHGADGESAPRRRRRVSAVAPTAARRRSDGLARCLRSGLSHRARALRCPSSEWGAAHVDGAECTHNGEFRAARLPCGSGTSSMRIMRRRPHTSC